MVVCVAVSADPRRACASRAVSAVLGLQFGVQHSGVELVAELNPVLRGWAGYFRNGNSGRKFNTVDGYVHERLAIFASRKHGLKGRNWTTRYTYGWITRLGVYRLTGNVRGAPAHAQR